MRSPAFGATVSAIHLRARIVASPARAGFVERKRARERAEHTGARFARERSFDLELTYALGVEMPDGVLLGLEPRHDALGNVDPAHVDIESTRFFTQSDYQCGPAALATVLSAAAVDVTPDQLVPEV